MSAAESFTAVRWRCPHCRRSWSSKARANEHVAQCWHDPANRTCKTCVHHVPAEDGGCNERPGCGCMDITEHCLAEVDMTVQVAYWEAAGSPVQYRTETRVQVDCPLWEQAS